MKYLKLEIGKKYQLRNGLTTEPLKKSDNGTNFIFIAKVKEPEFKIPSLISWLKSGRVVANDIDFDHDIVKEI